MNFKKIFFSTILILFIGFSFTGCIVNFDPDKLPSYDEEINKSSFEYKMGTKSWVKETASKTTIDNQPHLYYDEYQITSNNTLKRTYYICTTKQLPNDKLAIKEKKYYINVYYNYSISQATENYFHVELEPYLTETKLPPILVGDSDIKNFLTSEKTKHFEFKINSTLEIDNILYK